MFHDDGALQFGVGRGALRLMVVLPRPEPGAFGRLGKAAVRIAFGVYQRDITLVLLGLLIHELEDTPDARETHGDHGILLRRLVDRLRKLTGHAQKGEVIPGERP